MTQIVLILLFKLQTGTSFELLAQVFDPSDRTLRRWYNRLTADGVWVRLFEEALRAYDTVIGLRLDQFLTDTTKVKPVRAGVVAGL